MGGPSSGAIYWIVFCFLILVPSTFAQQGFLSINCCATKNSTDENNITWITDYGWFPDNSHCHEISRPVQDSQSYFVRGFAIDSGKRCYSLPTIHAQNYILRGTFVHLDSLPPSTFDVLVGVTRISTVELPDDVVVEVIFRAANVDTDFCLLKEEGDPLISQLELRPLNVSYYLNWDDTSLLKLVSRVYLGNLTEEIRFPDDPYDRIWNPAANRMNYEVIITSKDMKDPSTEVPGRVLEMAVQDSDKLVFRKENLDAYDGISYMIFLYFLEINDKVELGQRVFDVFVNGVKKVDGFDIKANGSDSNMVSINVMANGFLNITLVKVRNAFNFGPICSAYEIFRIYPRVEGSRQEDVSMMVNVRNELLIENNESEIFTSWSGDPCLPVPWKALECMNLSGSSAVTTLDLSANYLQGSIPSEMTMLKHLNELNLSNNQFTGSIPSFPLSSKLTSLDVRQNDLIGLIPESLFMLPDLKFLYFGCNPRMDNGLMHMSNNSRLITDNGACGDQGSSHSKNGLVISTVACGSFLLSIAVGIFLICSCKRKLAHKGHDDDDDDKGHPMTKNAVYSIPSPGSFILKSISIQTYSLEYIEAVTQKYKTLIGEGGFGSVYQGTLSDGQEVAVKVRSATSLQGTREFENELNLLSAIRHENLVPLMGFCCERDQQILVYPFMSNGSLQDRLYGEPSKRKVLDWPTRLSIALGAARGLAYLHSFSGRCIIHRDVKSSNILLDHSMLAKVADFGFSKYAPLEGDSGTSLEVRGTAGYLDPEYYSTQHLSAKSDVFSFGVVLLEIISGREPLNIQKPRNEWSLVEWAKPLYREQKIEEMVDPELKGMFHVEAMWRVVEVALTCIEPFSAYRPAMSDIVRELEDALIIETNASEYMKSIDSLGGSNRFSIILDRKNSNSRSLSSVLPSASATNGRTSAT